MRETVKASLALVVVVCFFICVFWLSDGGLSKPANRTMVGWTVPIGIVALAVLLKIHLRKDQVPDFLRELTSSVLESNGLCFCPRVVAHDGQAYLQLWFQNRYERASSAKIAIKPSMGFFLTRSKIETIALVFECGPAGFGVVQMPLPIPEKHQGSVQSFDIGADVRYPKGKGRMLRFRDGLRVGAARFNRVADQLLTVAAATAGVIAVSSPASFRVGMPSGVAEEVSGDGKIEVTQFWTLGDEQTTIGELQIAG